VKAGSLTLDRGDALRRNTLEAILLVAASSLAFALMGACVKGSTASVPFLVAVFFRSVVGMLPLLAYFAWKRRPVRAVQHLLLFVRSLFGFTAMCMFFLAIEALPLSTAVILNFSSPIFVVILSGLFLHERTAAVVLPMVAVAFGGVALLVSPDFSTSKVEAILGLASAFFAAMAYVTIKRLSRTESPTTIVLFFSIYSSLFSVVAVALAGATGLIDLCGDGVIAMLANPRELALLLGVGIAGTAGQVLLTAAYSRERASIVSPFQYLSPVFSYVIGLLLFDEVPTIASIGGGLMVMAASVGVLLVSREKTHPVAVEPVAQEVSSGE